MAAGFGRNEILSLIAGGALAVPALVGAVAMLYAVGQAPAITQRVERMAIQLPWQKPAKPAKGQPHAAPTPMAVPHRPHAVRAHQAAHHAVPATHHAAPATHHAAPAAHHPAPGAALAAMRVDHDEMRGLVSYTDQTTDESNRSATGVHCYVAKAAHAAPTLYLRVRWVSRRSAERLGLEALYFHVDGRKYAIDNPPYGLLEVQGDISVTSEQAWEWYDTQVDRRRLAMLRAIAGSRTAVVRFDGTNGQAKHVVTQDEKAAITRVLTAYESLR